MLRTENITYGDIVVPAGTVVDAINLTFTKDDGTHVGVKLVPGSSSGSMDLPEGNYVATAQALDAVGNAIGMPVTDTFVVAPAPTATVSVPTALTGA